MRSAVFWERGVGGYVGGRLAHAGETVESVNVIFFVQPVNATGDPSQAENVDVCPGRGGSKAPEAAANMCREARAGL